MAVSQKRIDAVLEASTVKWGKKHCRSFLAVANTANVLAGKYLPINYMDADLNEVNGYIWFNDGVAVNPAPTGLTLIDDVPVTSGDAATVVAASIKTVLDALAPDKFLKVVAISGATITIENKYIGAISAETDPNTTGIADTVLIAGVGLNLGATSEGIEISFEVSSVDITSNQTGGLIADQIYQGSAASLSMSLIEVSKDRFDLLVGEVTGGNFTPVGGTKVSGYGESRLFQSLSDLGGMLILHPIRLPDADKSSDYVFWKSAPVPESLTFDGTAPQALTTGFVAYLDASKKKEINLFARGDWTQDGLDA